MSKLTKATLLTALMGVNKPQEVTIDGVEQSFYVRRISVKEQGEVSKAAEAHDSDPMLGTIGLFIFGVCDADGKPLFSMTDEDIEAVRNMDLKTLTDVVAQVTRINGFDKAAETIEKN